MGRDGREGWIAKEHQETLGSNGCVRQLVCNNGFMGVYVFKTHQIVGFKYVQFIEYQLRRGRAVCKKKKKKKWGEWFL